MNNFRQPGYGRSSGCGSDCPSGMQSGYRAGTAYQNSARSCSDQNATCSSSKSNQVSGRAHSDSDQRSSQRADVSRGCDGDMKRFPLAMAYVPMQTFENLKTPREAIQCGTLFTDLYLDFAGRRCS